MKLKKKLIPVLPYMVIALAATKLPQAWRLAPGADVSEKLLCIGQGVDHAFSSLLPSLYPEDVLIGVLLAALLRIVVVVKGRNAKKYRHNTEYGSARWGTHEDIEPYMNPKFRGNKILTATELLTMESRPKNPKYARNKNVLVVGGSGSGKTRFFVLPNLMQCHSSYVVTDPKGQNLLSC